jgi:hypothetical protein
MHARPIVPPLPESIDGFAIGVGGAVQFAA